MSNVLDRVKQIVSMELRAELKSLTPETNFVNDLGCDSLDAVELVMDFEEEFNIDIPDDKEEGIKTIQQAVTAIEEALAQR